MLVADSKTSLEQIVAHKHYMVVYLRSMVVANSERNLRV